MIVRGSLPLIILPKLLIVEQSLVDLFNLLKYSDVVFESAL